MSDFGPRLAKCAAGSGVPDNLWVLVGFAAGSIWFDDGPSAFLSGPLHAIRFLAHRTPVQNDALMGASNRNDWSRQLCAIHEATQAAKKQVPMRR